MQQQVPSPFSTISIKWKGKRCVGWAAPFHVNRRVPMDLKDLKQKQVHIFLLSILAFPSCFNQQGPTKLATCRFLFDYINLHCSSCGRLPVAARKLGRRGVWSGLPPATSWELPQPPAGSQQEPAALSPTAQGAESCHPWNLEPHSSPAHFQMRPWLTPRLQLTLYCKKTKIFK